jgi:hypothetical protein
MKPIKRGIKVWVLADSVNGYFIRLEVYTGKQGDKVETGLGSRVVRSLTADFKGKHYMVLTTSSPATTCWRICWKMGCMGVGQHEKTAVTFQKS